MEMDAVIATYDLDGDPIHDDQERCNATADLQAFQVIKETYVVLICNS